MPGASQPEEAFSLPANSGSDGYVPPGGAQAGPLFPPFDPAVANGAEPEAPPSAPAAPSTPSYQPPQPPQPPTVGLDGSSLQVSGLDALAQPGAPDAAGARYSLGPLAPVPPDGLGRRRALPGGEAQHLPHQPVPEPRRETETLPPGAAALGAVPPVSPPPSATTPQPADGALPRRVRKAPSHPDWPTSQIAAVAGPVPPQDAQAVRDALEDFQAGVERANRDSAEQTTQLPTRRQAARHAGPATPERDGKDQ